MYKTFIEPDLKTAHLRIFNSFNPFSGLMNATYILKSAHPVTKQLIKVVLKVLACSAGWPAIASHLVCESQHRTRRWSIWHAIWVTPQTSAPDEGSAAGRSLPSAAVHRPTPCNGRVAGVPSGGSPSSHWPAFHTSPGVT